VHTPHSTNPRPSDRLAQWRREAPPRRLRSTPSPSSSGSAAGGPKVAVIYIGATPTPSPWTPPGLLPPPTTVEILNSWSTCFYSVVIDLLSCKVVHTCITVYCYMLFVPRLDTLLVDPVSITSLPPRQPQRPPLQCLCACPATCVSIARAAPATRASTSRAAPMAGCIGGNHGSGGLHVSEVRKTTTTWFVGGEQGSWRGEGNYGSLIDRLVLLRFKRIIFVPYFYI
jgi:hypothetical protein